VLQKTLIAVFIALPSFCSAETYLTYDCTVKQQDAKAEKDIWSGPIVLMDRAFGSPVLTASEGLVIEKTGTGISVRDIWKNSNGIAAMKKALKPYNGLLMILLSRAGSDLHIHLGHVDSAAKDDLVPMEVDAWAPVEARKIGVADVRRGLTAECQSR
jgi:hypothetical protein